MPGKENLPECCKEIFQNKYITKEKAVPLDFKNNSGPLITYNGNKQTIHLK
jgi:hypothetical protein